MELFTVENLSNRAGSDYLALILAFKSGVVTTRLLLLQIRDFRKIMGLGRKPASTVVGRRSA